MEPIEAFRKARSVLSRLRREDGWRTELEQYGLNSNGELFCTDAHQAIFLAIDDQYLPDLDSDRYLIPDFENKPHKSDEITITRPDDKDVLIIENECECKSDHGETVVGKPSDDHDDYPDLQGSVPDYKRANIENSFSCDAELLENVVSMLNTDGGKGTLGPKSKLTLYFSFKDGEIDREQPMTIEGEDGLGVVMPLRTRTRSSVKFDGDNTTARWIVKAKPKHWVALNENGELLVEETYRQRSDVLDLFGLTSDRLKRIEPGTYRVKQTDEVPGEVETMIEQIREEARQ